MKEYKFRNALQFTGEEVFEFPLVRAKLYSIIQRVQTPHWEKR